MPTYDYRCVTCGWHNALLVTIIDRDGVQCPRCGGNLHRLVGAPLFRFAGVPTKGGGPDKFTADMLGLPLKDLPEGLKVTS